MSGVFQAEFSQLKQLAALHYENSRHFKSIADLLFPDWHSAAAIEDLPYIPAELFKYEALKSIPETDVFKVMQSSGTTSQQRSKIFLDRETARKQTKALSSIIAPVFGRKRVPMLIIDHPGQIQNRASFSARGAGILGFSMFASSRHFALNDDMSLNLDAIAEFLNIEAERKMLFGFTAIIWQELLQRLDGIGLGQCVGKAALLHGGGWKKLAGQNISPQQFRAQVMAKLPLVTSVHDYYGMVEQTGSIFLGCSAGHLHTNSYNDVLCRDVNTLEVLPHGQAGALQVLSTLPTSYPGFSILTEDSGTILGQDDCPCGQPGKYFAVHGRLAQAEVRGCSDTYERAA
ncbi:MAG: acyl-protein synthetase [Pseudomonadota bacterium]